MPKKRKVAGQILDVGGERIAIIGETLQDALDIDHWEVVSDNTLKRSPDEERKARNEYEEWEKRSKANPPKRII